MVQRPPAPPPPTTREVSPTESDREEEALPNHEEELLELRKDVMVAIEKLYESNDVMAEEIRSASSEDLTEARELYSYIEENMDVLERKFRTLRAINRKLGLPEEEGCCGQPKIKLPLGPKGSESAKTRNLNANSRRTAVKAFLDNLQEHLVEGALSSRWSPRDAAVLVGAVAKITKDGRGYEDLTKFIGEPIEFATVASGFSRLPMGCGRKVMREMARVLPDRLAEFGEQELCNTVQAYARLEILGGADENEEANVTYRVELDRWDLFEATKC
ncbi:hypothetical protein Pmar_PMAR024060 [Perkinsus marinus ATCC 50983]|uniref:Uncharacterized protein n=1 Tax=Perkinsus marinus (strain ATCC 50983 / TXsc) TaxID=423536 RepID=C5L6J4_PERM5|nr:hypothetical protein Pmar_PMAR024060 [Perkinsus marinus ATCC 50983]EER07655.1 hypothetical protein Pmar_PMAR024060 [Perkinsus marinus ATCC 50983]|eukprot:XP_002775839.1 hypothetical protein Pmar_PMAR024060 [Perkinsus marinus ATCC 50983]